MVNGSNIKTYNNFNSLFWSDAPLYNSTAQDVTLSPSLNKR